MNENVLATEKDEIHCMSQVRDADRARRFEALRAELAGEPKPRRRLDIKLILDKAEEALIVFSLSAWPFMFTLLVVGWFFEQFGW